MLSRASSRMSSRSSDINSSVEPVQTYGKLKKYAVPALVILFQHRILKRYQLGCFGQLSIFFLSRFGYEKPGRWHQIIDTGDQGKEYKEYRTDEECTIEGPEQEYDPDHDEVDRNEH